VLNQPRTACNNIPVGAPDIDRALLPEREAWTLPPSAYASPQIYDAEVRHIFRKNWLPVGRTEQIPNAGDYFSVDLFGDALVVVRGRDGGINCLSRVCLHRGAELVTGSGSAPGKLLLCPYHNWSYDLEGHLRAAPMTDDLQGFDKKACKLPSLRVETSEGFIFVNFDPDAPPLAPRLGGFTEFFGPYRLGEMLLHEEVLEFDSPYNWKVLTENFMEAYHHIGPHQNTLRDPYPVEHSFVPDNAGEDWSILAMPGRSDNVTAFPPLDTITDWRRDGLVAAVAFPYTLLAAASDGALWYEIAPTAHDHFRLRIRFLLPRSAYGHPEFAERFAAWKGLVEHVHGEDHAINLKVWRGLRSGLSTAGRLTRHERAIWQMNRWWCRQMQPALP